MSICSSPQYTTPNGLNFELHCGVDFGVPKNVVTAHFIGDLEEASLEDCLNACSTYGPTDCYAISYDTAKQVCNFFDSDAITGNGNFTSRSTFNVAVAPASQFQAPVDLSCPYPESSVQSSSQGQKFSILCNQDFYDFGDYTREYPPYTPHADTLEECLSYCSEAHPLCEGVSWNIDVTRGYGNCYLKNDPFAGTPVTHSDWVTHSAEITQDFFWTVDVPCSAGSNSSSTQSSPDGSYDFTVHCSQTRTGTQNITSVHQSDLSNCLGACSNRVNDGCAGVVFDQSMLGGFENCYLLKDTGTAVYPVNMTFAELQTGSEDTSDDSSGSGSSKAWIAGPVIGVILALVLCAAALWWWQRRRGSSQHMYEQPGAQEKDSYPRYEKSGISVTGSSSSAAELAQPVGNPFELHDRNSERMYQHEMQS